MRTWATSRADHRDPRMYWAQVVRDAIFELDFEAEDPAFAASLNQFELGAIRLSSVSIESGHKITRSPKAVKRSVKPHFNLNYLRSGMFKVSHYGHELSLGPGDIVLLDNRQPYQVISSNSTRHVSVHIPVEWLHAMMPTPESGVARVISPGSPWHAALAAMLEDAQQIEQYFAGAGELASRQIAGALALALGRGSSQNSQHTRLLLLRAREVILTRYYEQDLDAEFLAAALNISKRYLYRLFSREGSTVGREILRIRLENAAKKIASAEFADLSIAEISWRCGFSDPSYFSKCFRNHFKMPPGAYRAGPPVADRLHS